MFNWFNKEDDKQKTFGDKLQKTFNAFDDVQFTSWLPQNLLYKLTNDDIKELWFKTTFPLISVYPIDWKWPFLCINRTPRASDMWTVYSNDESEMFLFYPKTKEDVILAMKFV